MLEEAQLPYELLRYQRNPHTQLAPEELKAIHPLGKSPVVEIASREFIVGQRLTGADFMLGFVVKLVTERFNLGQQYPNILRYSKRLSDTPSWQKAQHLESTPA
ncbi:glutathione binding-like protein [Dickeya dianthicola]|uniref:glutathione binding-like protein n=1 Tax=Dickeya dianthicola TaxID=204039 RepID=UPI001F4551C6|nr:glutathione binding-like protein [Dickeya dianthicola]MCI4238569.1 hypothetical protein [Dickeya dianthicola]MCI4255300.1 hypothetical protein [Dickeya dianthicola]